MTAILLPICRGALRSAEWLLPKQSRGDWNRQWRGDLWRWMCADASAGAPDGFSPLLGHTLAAFRDALQARLHVSLGSPAFCLAAMFAMLATLALATDGFAITRLLAGGLPYRDADRVVLLAQGPSTLGVRLGFAESDAEVFRQNSRTVATVATYTWTSAKFRDREVSTAKVSRDFFGVLGVAATLPEETFLASHDFWRGELSADPGAIGRWFPIDGRQLRLAGVLPREFSFLGAPISIWMTRAVDPPVPKDRWWLGLRGTVARLKPDVAPEAAAKELRQLLVDAAVARRGSQVHVTPVRAAVYRAAGTYGRLFLLCAAGILAWASVRAYRSRRARHSWRPAMRFEGFLCAKTLLLALAVFLFVFECTGVNRLGVTGGIWWMRELFAMWVTVCGVAMAVVWSRRDQRQRCRQCLYRMRQPVRIGVPGQMLLDPAGEEVMCPKGHGSVYTSESVLGSEMSERWLSLEEIGTGPN